MTPVFVKGCEPNTGKKTRRRYLFLIVLLAGTFSSVFGQHSLTICSGGVPNFAPAGNASSLRYTWGVPTVTPAGAVTVSPQNTPQVAVNQTLINNTSDPAVVTYNVAVSDGSTFTLDVTVNPTPRLSNSTATTNICSGANFNFTISSATGGTSFNWVRPLSTGITPNTNTGTGNISEALTNTTNNPVTATYQVTLSANGCSNAQNIAVVVNPLPVLNSPLFPADVCSGSQFAYLPSSNQSDINFTWSRAVVAGISNAAATGSNSPDEILTNTTLSPIVVPYVYTLTSTATGCVKTQTVTIDINPLPSLSSSTTNQIICSGTSFNYTPASILGGTSIAWSRPGVVGISPNSGIGNGNINEVLVNFSNLNAATVTYNFTLSKAGCVNNQSFDVTVNPRPELSSSMNTNVLCSASPFNYTPTSLQSNITFAWSRSFIPGISNAAATGTDNPQEALTNTTNNTVVTLYTYTLTNGVTGCSNMQNIFVAVSPIPSLTNGSINICNNQAFSYDPPGAPTNTTYTWTTPVISPTLNITGGSANASESQYISQGLSNVSGSSATATYTVTPKTNGCVGSTFNLVVTVAPGATPTIPLNSQFAPPPVCSNSFFNYTALSSANNPVFAWRRYPAAGISNAAPATGIGASISEQLVNATTAPAFVTYAIAVSSAGCTNTHFITATVNPATALNSSLTPAAICSNTQFSYTPTSLTPSTTQFNWNRAFVPGISNVTASGTNNPNEPLINTTNNPIDVVYTYNLVTSAGCSNTQDVTVRVNPTPKLTTTTATPTAVCSGSTFLFNPTSPTAGGPVIFKWTRSAINGISNGSSAGLNSAEEDLINTTTNPLTVIYNYTTIVSGCTNTEAVSIVVNPVPIVTNKTAIICSNSSFSTTISNVPSGTIYSWGLPVSSPAGAVTGGSSGTLQNAIGQQLFNTSLEPGNLFYTVTPSANGCTGLNFTVAVTVNPAPVASSVTLPAICSGASFNYIPPGIQSGTLYSWGNAVQAPVSTITGANAEAARTSIGQSLVNLTNAVATAVYTVTPVANGCPGNLFTVSVPVNPVAKILTQSASVCSGNNFSVLPSPVPSGTSYTWTTPVIVPTGTVAGSIAQATPVTSVSQFVTNTSNTPAQAQYLVTPITGSCAGTAFPVNITVNPSTALSSSLTAPAICSNNNFSYVPSSNTPSTTTFNWSRAAVTGIVNPAASGANNLSEVLVNNSNTPITVTYVYNLATSAGCTNTQNVTVVVNPIPVLTSLINPPAVCSGNTFNYFPASNVTGTNFSWSRNLQAFITNGAAIGNNNPGEVLVNGSINTVPVVYNYTLAANGCFNQQNITVQIQPTPVVPNQVINTCSNNAFTLNPTNTPANTLYTWATPVYNPGGTLTGGSAQLTGVASLNQTLINQTLNSSIATYTIVPSTGACFGSAFTLAVTVQPIPVVPNQSLATVCSGSPFNFTASNVPTGTTYTWLNPVIAPFNSLTGGSAQSVGVASVNQTLSSTNNLVNNASYTVTPAVNGCIGNDFILNVSVNPTPVISPIADTICTGSSISIIPGSVPANTRYTWTLPTTQPFGAVTGAFAQTFPSGNIFQTLINTTNAPAKMVYTVTPTAGFCAGTPFPLTVHVGTILPAIANQNAEICSGSAFNTTPVNAPSGTTYTWNLPVVTPANTITGATNAVFQRASLSETLNNTSPNSSTVVYTVTAKNTGCISNTFTATVTVLPVPRISVTGNTEICRYPFDTLTLNFVGQAPWRFSYTENNGVERNITGITSSPYRFAIPSTNESSRMLAFTNVAYGACLNSTDTIKFRQIIHSLPTGTLHTRRGIYLCNNIPDTLFITSPDSLGYQWLHNGSALSGFTNDSIVTGFAGRYNAALTNRYGCIDTVAQPITLIKINQPLLKFAYDTYCVDIPMYFTNLTDTNTTGPIVWQWDFGNNNIRNGYNTSNTYSLGGNHHVKLTATQLYCPATPTSMDSTINLQIPIAGVTMPSVSAYKTVPKAIGVRSLPGYRYRWTPSWGINPPNQANVTFNYTTTQQYAVELISPAGCITRDSLLVRVFDDKLVEIMIPKSFSPNGDGVNDKLYPYLSGVREFRYFRIFNRFNQLMFESKNHDEGWNGTVNGVLQPMGIYIWIAVGVADDGSMIQRTGQTLLLR